MREDSGGLRKVGPSSKFIPVGLAGRVDLGERPPKSTRPTGPRGRLERFKPAGTMNPYLARSGYRSEVLTMMQPKAVPLKLAWLRGDRSGKRFSRSATDGSRIAIIVQHRSLNRGAACIRFDEERQFDPSTGRSSAANT